MYICVAQSIVCECDGRTRPGLLAWERREGAARGEGRARSCCVLVGRPAAGGPPAGRGSSVLAPVLDPLARRVNTEDGRAYTLTRPARTPYPQPTYEMRTYSQAHDGDITRNVCESGAERRRRPRDRPATSRGDAVVRTSGPPPGAPQTINGTSSCMPRLSNLSSTRYGKRASTEWCGRRQECAASASVHASRSSVRY
jgi:hypothetical protein